MLPRVLKSFPWANTDTQHASKKTHAPILHGADNFMTILLGHSWARLITRAIRRRGRHCLPRRDTNHPGPRETLMVVCWCEWFVRELSKGCHFPVAKMNC